mmetsp:Transcript_62485/g.116118  ORF Transcript_62485/g.116118 Transcript_62485/m.116118 type:complete len:223 (+) Transcript_62485:400-1068(+)
MKVAVTSQQKSPSLKSLIRGLPSASASPDAELSSEPDSELELPPSSSARPPLLDSAGCAEAAAACLVASPKVPVASLDATCGAGDASLGTAGWTGVTTGACATAASNLFCSLSALSFLDFFPFSFPLSLSLFLFLCGAVSADPAASAGRFTVGATGGAGRKADGRAGGAGRQPSGSNGGGALPILCPAAGTVAAITGEAAGLGAMEPGCISWCSTRISSNAF